MKIVYHHRTRGRGAEGAHIMGIVNAFRALNHQVDLLSLPGSDPEKPQEEEEHQGSSSVVLRIIHKLMVFTKYVPEFLFELIELSYNLVASIRVGRSLSSKKVDFLYERYSLFMFAGVLQAKRKGIPIILEVNDSAIVERVRPLFFKRLAKRIESWVFRKCDGIVFISTNFKNTVEREHGKVAHSVICPNAADITQFTLSGIDKAQAKENLGLSGKVVCGYVGAFIYWHGIDWFVKEIAPSLSKHPDLALLLVGDGVVFEEIKSVIIAAKLESQVIMPGRVPHSEVRNYIAAMDYGILPDSNQYGSPMKLFEMMAMGVALVSPSFEPISEVLVDNENGWLFEPNDRAGAVQKVIDLSKDIGNIKRVGGNSEAYIRNYRQWTHNVDILLSLLEKTPYK